MNINRIQLPSIILASSSPRRRQLLQQIGVAFTIQPPDVPEDLLPNEKPIDFVQRLALEKARSVAESLDSGITLGSDTIVVLGERILGKPENQDDAFAMLAMLSGNTHTVYTGFALVDSATGKSHIDYGSAHVTFRELGEDEIRAYIATGSPMDKAGSYGIQDDYGAVFIEKIDGDYYSVVGLPLAKVYIALRSFATD